MADKNIFKESIAEANKLYQLAVQHAKERFVQSHIPTIKNMIDRKLSVEGIDYDQYEDQDQLELEADTHKSTVDLIYDEDQDEQKVQLDDQQSIDEALKLFQKKDKQDDEDEDQQKQQQEDQQSEDTDGIDEDQLAEAIHKMMNEQQQEDIEQEPADISDQLNDKPEPAQEDEQDVVDDIYPDEDLDIEDDDQDLDIEDDDEDEDSKQDEEEGDEDEQQDEELKQSFDEQSLQQELNRILQKAKKKDNDKLNQAKKSKQQKAKQKQQKEKQKQKKQKADKKAKQKEQKQKEKQKQKKDKQKQKKKKTMKEQIDRLRLQNNKYRNTLQQINYSLKQSLIVNQKSTALNTLTSKYKLNTQQKQKLQKILDKQTSVEGVKLVYQTLDATLSGKSTKPRMRLEQIAGGASRSTGSTKSVKSNQKSSIITQNNKLIKIFQKRAGII